MENQDSIIFGGGSPYQFALGKWYGVRLLPETPFDGFINIHI